MANQTWGFRNFTAAEGTAGAVAWLNEPDRQGPGEAIAFARNDGSVGLFYLEPGSLGSSTNLTWGFRNFSAAEGTAGAVTWLNEAERQGHGEAIGYARNDGSVSLFYLEPGSLGSSTRPTWGFRDFSAAEGTAGAVTWLNEAERQGRGEASPNARNNGTVGLFYLEPGSLGSSTQPTWGFRDFSAAEGAAGAITWLNEAPRQGPGEGVPFARGDGSVGLFFLEPGTG